MRRVNEVLRQVISDAITNDLSDPRLEMATVTSVDTTPDLRHAKVYFTVLGDDEAKAEALKGLKRAHSVLQGKVAAETRMKHTPALAFEYDESIESGMRIDALLSEGAEADGKKE
jgi:ribosome-binding factor A